MAWVTIADSDIDPDSPITTSLMTALRDNPIAIADGSAGAPAVQTAALEQTGGIEAVTQACVRASAIGTTELKTGTSSNSTSATLLDFTMAGGQYAFLLQCRTSNGSFPAASYGSALSGSNSVFTTSTSAITNMRIGATAGGTCFVNWRYVNASPPYDMGDGDIPLFMFALVDNTTGDVIALSVADDPVWVHNGPTNCMPDVIEADGKKYRFIKVPTPAIEAMPIQARAAAIQGLTKTRVEITQQMLHQDMNVIPHPFINNDLTNRTAVLLDPISDTMHKLRELRDVGESLDDIVYGGFLNIGNTQLNRVTPNGVLIPSVGFNP